ncbi:MAG: PAS domain-containing protein [Planctomycetota bacterium]
MTRNGRSSRWTSGEHVITTLKALAIVAVVGLAVHLTEQRGSAADEFDDAWQWAQSLQVHIDVVDGRIAAWRTGHRPQDAARLIEALEASDLRASSPLRVVWYQDRLRHWEGDIARAQAAIQRATTEESDDPAAARKELDELRRGLASVRAGAHELVGSRTEKLAAAYQGTEILGLAVLAALAALLVIGFLRRHRRTRVVRREAAPGNVIEGLERVIAQLPSPLLLLEPATGRVRLANPTAIEHLGLVRKDVMGQPFADALAPTASGSAPRFQATDAESSSAVVGLRSARAPERRVLVHTTPIRFDGRSWLWAQLDSLSGGAAREAITESRSQFRLLAESIPGAAYLLTRRGEEWTVAFMGQGVHTLTGLDPQVFTRGRRELDERIHPTDRPGVDEEIATALEEGRPWFVTYRLQHLDGSERWVEEYGQGVRDTRGVVRYLQGTLFDVTRRRETQDELKAERERGEIMLRSITDAVIGLDAEGRVQQMNEAAVQLLGVTERAARGRPLESVASFESASGATPFKGVAAWVRPDGGGRGSEVQLVTRDRGVRQIVVAGAPLRGPNGEEVGVVVVLRDITDHMRREEELLRAAKLESVGVLAGGIAHDFNNILAGIIGNLSLARMDVEAESDTGYSLQQALDAAVRAQDLTRQLLTFAKGGAPLRRPVVLTKGLLETVAFALRGSNVRCTPDVAPDLAAVEADQGQILQVLQNLVINATQAMPEGGDLIVKATTTSVVAGDGTPIDPGRYVEIVVADQGCGIPPEALQRIFDPYFTTKQEGTGLGLATSYAIVRRHGGSILVDSHVDVGTTFRVFLPACKAELPQPEEVLDRLLRARQGTGRILVMDDEATVRDVCSRMLKSLGYRPSTAENGQQALELYAHAMGKKQPFDLVIMDLSIPDGMGGAEATRRLLELDAEACIIASSGHYEDPVLLQPEEHGFRGVLDKPYRQEDLGAMLREHLGRAPTANPSAT